MPKIKIKNFGPIKEGFKEILPDGTVNEWMDVKKVTVFIGNQGSGKSTVAKLISLFMWLEKSTVRGDINDPIINKGFDDLLGFHRIKNYLKENTKIEYEGQSCKITMIKNNGTNTPHFSFITLDNEKVTQPKIMYVPAERNFLSTISNINKVSDLIVGSLKSYAVEFRNAQNKYSGKPIDLPINNTRVIYDAKDDDIYLLFDDKKLKLSEGSSGFHSIVPLYWVTQHLTEFIKQDEIKLLELLSTDQTIRREKEIRVLNTEKLEEKALKANEKKINEKYVPKYFVNIVEEPEQNLFPTSQKLLLNSLLAFNNGSNILVMTTHSPYLINYLTLAVEAHYLKEKVKSEELENKLKSIVPLDATIAPGELVVYELDETNGTIQLLDSYKGLPSDDNKLNYELGEGNEDFAKLLEIEQKL